MYKSGFGRIFPFSIIQNIFLDNVTFENDRAVLVLSLHIPAPDMDDCEAKLLEVLGKFLNALQQTVFRNVSRLLSRSCRPTRMISILQSTKHVVSLNSDAIFRLNFLSTQARLPK